MIVHGEPQAVAEMFSALAEAQAKFSTPVRDQ